MSKCDFKYRVRRIKEKGMYKLIRMTPSKLKYFIAIDVLGYATTGKYGSTVVNELTAMDAIGRYGKDKGVE